MHKAKSRVIPAKPPQSFRIDSRAAIETDEYGAAWLVTRVPLAHSGDKPREIGALVSTGSLQVSDFVQMTTMEKRVAPELLGGLSNKEIASGFHLTERAIKSHCSNLYKKFRVRSRKEFVFLMLMHKRPPRHIFLPESRRTPVVPQ